MAEFLTVDPYCNDGTYPDKEADIELIQKTGAKFIGRAIYRWGDEEVLNEPEFWQGASSIIKRVHEFDSDVIFQAAIFEAIYRKGVSQIKIPAWAFELLDLPVENRYFNYDAMLFSDGSFADMWGKDSSVPDITKEETQLWYAFLLGSYINIGIEAVHLGQVHLTGRYDKEWAAWDHFLTKMRAYANKKARRHFLLVDAHAGRSGMMIGQRSLIDHNAFPLRIKEVVESPMDGILEMGHFDSLYGMSKGCITPSGWHCDALPYIVEFDNFGYRSDYGTANLTDHYVWGYDEITWFYLQSEERRKEWLRYTYHWLKENDPNGFLEMPGARVVSIPKQRGIMSRAVDKSESVPYGMGIADTIAELWESN